MILQGRVTVEGKVVKDLATRVDPAKVAVTIDGQRVQSERMVYFAVNKPKGYVSTNNDPTGRPRVVDLLPEIPQRVYTVGRLDEMSVGLMLLTNDGELANKLSHPKFGVEKVYRVVVAGAPSQEVLDKLIEGVWLAEGKVRARRIKAIARKGEATVLDMVLAEGKNREVRRMLAKLGHKVMALTRVAIGPITLKGLDPGAFRTLRFDEVELLRRVGDGPADPRPPVRRAQGGEAVRPTPFRRRPPAGPRPAFASHQRQPRPRARPDRPAPPADRPREPALAPERGTSSVVGPCLGIGTAPKTRRRAASPPAKRPCGRASTRAGTVRGSERASLGFAPETRGWSASSSAKWPWRASTGTRPARGSGGASRRVATADRSTSPRCGGSSAWGMCRKAVPCESRRAPRPASAAPLRGKGKGNGRIKGRPLVESDRRPDQGRDRDRDRGRGGPPPQGRGRQGHDQGQGPLPQRRQGGQGRDQGPGQNQGGPRRPEPPPRREPPAPPSRPTLTVFDESSASGPPSRRPAPRARPQIGSRPMPKAKRPRPRPTEGGGPSDE